MSPFSLMSRYLTKYFMAALILSMLMLTGLISLFDIIDLLRRTAPYDHITFHNVLHLALLKTPQMFHILLPFAVLFASLYVFFKLTKTGELVIMRAVGISAWKFIAPLWISAFLIGIFDITIINPFAVSMTARFNRLEERLGLVKASSLAWSPQGFWLREIRDGKPVILRASSLKQQNKTLLLENLSVFELTQDEILDREIESPLGVLHKGMLTLYNNWVVTPEKKAEKQEKIILPTSLSVKQIVENFASTETISFWRLPQRIEFLNASGFSSLKQRVHFYSLIVFPFYLICMVFIASIFTLNPNQRQGKNLYAVMSAVLCGFLFFFASKITSAFGVSQTLPILLSVTAPVLIAFPIASAVLLNKEDG